jgi:hypothetical protein
MSSQPLTHHEILALIEPFSRRGYQADLGASQRLDRRLAFRPVEHDADAVPRRIVETLVLVSQGGTSFRVERHLAAIDGPSVELIADGTEPGDLLERVLSIEPGQPFEAGPGYCVGFSGRIAAVGGPVALSEAIAHIGHWRLTLEADPVRGMPADVSLTRNIPDTAAVPEDLLAVLGRDWGLLRPSGKGWSGTVRLRGRDARRDERTRAHVLDAARHLASTFSRHATEFHEDHRRSRWRVTLRRLGPLAAAVALILVGAACTRLDISSDATLRVLLMSSPPVLMILFFSLREVPRLELPPLPRATNAGRWPILDVTAAEGHTDER